MNSLKSHRRLALGVSALLTENFVVKEELNLKSIKKKTRSSFQRLHLFAAVFFTGNLEKFLGNLGLLVEDLIQCAALGGSALLIHGVNNVMGWLAVVRSAIS